MITPEDIYSKTNNGLDVIFHFYPQAKEVHQDRNKPFKVRSSDDTPSSFLKEVKGVWKVIDFGDEGRAISPIDICMREMDMKFSEAIHYLASTFNVSGEIITPERNKADIRRAPATEDEPDGYFHYEPNDKLTEKELAILGPRVRQEHCDLLGYSSVKFYKTTKDRKTTTVSSNENYPIFIRKCQHKDSMKNDSFFYKIYQPLNPDKAYRFFYKGDKPQYYINGLYELRSAYESYNRTLEREFREKNGEEAPYKYSKLPEAFICSGERDALCVKAFNNYPLWFNSETYNLSEFEYKEIMRYVERLYNIPDIDQTGVKKGVELAMKYIDIYTVWLPERLRLFRDQRGKPRKDFRDYCEIWPEKSRFTDLLNLAMPVCFWETVIDKGKKRLDINSDYVTYFLKCNGFVSLEDKNSKTGRMLAHIQGNVVQEVKINHVRKFLKQFVRERYMPVEIRNLVNNSTRLSEANIDMEEVELNFDDYTPDSQFFFFSNAIWEVKADGIKEHKLGSIDKYVWKEEVIEHNVKRLESTFSISKSQVTDEEDNERTVWDIAVRNDHGSNFFKYLINASRIYWRKEYEVEGELPEKLEEYKTSYKFAIDGPRLSPEEITEQKMHLINKIFCLGYLLHRYKAENRAWCIFAMDNKVGDSDDSNGGSGKSFCFKTPRLFMKTVTLPGRNPKLTENNHIYERVNEYIDYILIDDAVQYLDFGFFFDSVTGDITVNPKFSQSYEISFDKAPKFAITSNYTLRRSDPSTERRILYAVFSDYYHQKTADNDYRESRTIYDDFGKQLFRESYTEAEWNADINFFMDCCQFYLSVVAQGEKIQPPMDNVVDRNLRSEMTDLFYDWAEVYFSPGSPNCDKCIPKWVAMRDFERETKQTKWTTRKFTKALRAYCRYAEHIIDLDPNELKNTQGRIVRRYEIPPDKRSSATKPDETVPTEMIYVRTIASINYIDLNENDNTAEDNLPF